MCLRVVADGRILGDGRHPSAHDRHASRHLIPHVWHHEVVGCESVCLLAGKAILQLKNKMFKVVLNPS